MKNVRSLRMVKRPSTYGNEAYRTAFFVLRDSAKLSLAASADRSPVQRGVEARWARLDIRYWTSDAKNARVPDQFGGRAGHRKRTPSREQREALRTEMGTSEGVQGYGSCFYSLRQRAPGTQYT